jgi:basic membrane lipoprotein Med (substrate-binding protein (PBP1-ABC) superfamily)
VAVYDTIERGANGTLEGGTVLQYGLEEEGVGLSEMTYTRHIIPREYIEQVNEMKQQILDGELEVIDIRTLTEEQFAVVADNPTCANFDELRTMLTAE